MNVNNGVPRKGWEGLEPLNWCQKIQNASKYGILNKKYKNLDPSTSGGGRYPRHMHLGTSTPPF